MSLSTTKSMKSLTETIKITVLMERLEDVLAFCNLKNITQDLFFDEAIKSLFKKDAKWKQYQKQQKKLQKTKK